MNSQDSNKDLKRFDIAFETRQFEIGLFWKRSLFFWGFIAAAFVAIATLKRKEPMLSLLISGLGMVCSISWTLVNRGSKYWQEQWESKIEGVADYITGPLFKHRELPQQKRCLWLSGRRYSVSKLAIAVSDYVSLVWLVIFIRQAGITLAVPECVWCQRAVVLVLCAFPLIFAGLLLVCGRSQ